MPERDAYFGSNEEHKRWAQLAQDIVVYTQEEYNGGFRALPDAISGLNTMRRDYVQQSKELGINNTTFDKYLLGLWETLDQRGFQELDHLADDPRNLVHPRNVMYLRLRKEQAEQLRNRKKSIKKRKQ